MFAFVGAFFKRPLVIGLVFMFGWEQTAMALPGYMKRFTVAYYLQALVPHAMPSEGVVSLLQGIFRDTPPAPVSLFWLRSMSLFFCILQPERWSGRNIFSSSEPGPGRHPSHLAATPSEPRA